MDLATLMAERDAIAAKMRTLMEPADGAATKSLDADGLKELDALTKSLGDVQTKIASVMAAQAQLDALGGPEVPETFRGEKSTAAKSIGQHFVDSIGTKIARLGVDRGLTLTAEEYTGTKAATDTHVSSMVPAPLLTDVDRTPVRQYQRRLFLTDWLLSGSISGNAITYYVEKMAALEGAVAAIAENARKPQLHHTGWDPVTETLKKVAGFIKVSTEMLEDAAFLVTEIETRLLAELALAEEILLLSGNGTGQNPLGLLNRSGLQTETAAGEADLIEAIFRASQKVTLATGLVADGVVMNPADYQTVRLSKDLNGQYLAGGPFVGQYGNGSLDDAVRIWGLPIIVTPAIPQGTVLVGASQASTVYSKGSFVLSGTNTNEDDFVNNRVTILAEKRVTLAVRRPMAYVKVTVEAGE
ncbi:MULTISPECIES: phage major capsid protein [unclassified Microbacterium]|uniref:phage major capsid protein n=1 Tax=unclassified Microbacterium TaxID=2609290 RepID=UPI00343594ED